MASPASWEVSVSSDPAVRPALTWGSFSEPGAHCVGHGRRVSEGFVGQSLSSGPIRAPPAPGGVQEETRLLMGRR